MDGAQCPSLFPPIIGTCLSLLAIKKAIVVLCMFLFGNQLSSYFHHAHQNSGQMCGLCGNFNGNRSDEFRTPSGMMASTPSQFGTSWKVAGNYTCSDGCGSSCPRCANEGPARARCEVIQASDGPLSFCHEDVDPAPYFNDCVFDICVSAIDGQDLLCRAIEAYVSACQSANVRIYPWRQSTTCSE